MTLPTQPIHPPTRVPPEPAEPEPGPHVTAALATLSASPFVQLSMWRVWRDGIGLLDPGISRLITEAYVADHNATRSS